MHETDDKIRNALISAVTDVVNLAPSPTVCALSGGVDSAFVAAIARLPAVSAGVSGSHDLKSSQNAADFLGLNLTIHEISTDDVIAAVSEVVPILPNPTVMNAEIGITEYFICQTAHEENASSLLTGQGADELFAGYARYGFTEHLREDLDNDLAVYSFQQERDKAVANLWNITLLQPFMDERVIEVAKSLEPCDLVDGQLRKLALRRAAEPYLSHDLAWKPKKAMQYGTGVAKIIEKLARNEQKSPQEFIEMYR